MARKDDALIAQMAELLTAVGDALRPPPPTLKPGAWVKRDRVISERVTGIAINLQVAGEFLSPSQPAEVLAVALAAVRKAVERSPVTYPVRDEAEEVQP